MVDLVVDMKKGCVQAIVVPGPGRLCGLFGYDSEYVIPFECICKVGPDIILVDICEKNFSVSAGNSGYDLLTVITGRWYTDTRFWRKDGTSDEMSILRQSGHKSD